MKGRRTMLKIHTCCFPKTKGAIVDLTRRKRNPEPQAKCRRLPNKGTEKRDKTPKDVNGAEKPFNTSTGVPSVSSLKSVLTTCSEVTALRCGEREVMAAPESSTTTTGLPGLWAGADSKAHSTVGEKRRRRTSASTKKIGGRRWPEEGELERKADSSVRFRWGMTSDVSFCSWREGRTLYTAFRKLF